MIDEGLLEILRCPETHQKLARADTRLLGQLNARIAAGQVCNRAGRRVDQPLEEGLVRADGQVLYPVRSGIPWMLIEEAIPLAGLTEPAAQP